MTDQPTRPEIPDPASTGPQVRLIDLSAPGGAQEDAARDPERVVETVRGFASLDHANAFARAYVRDSLERCRSPGVSADEVLGAWQAFGEDAQVTDVLGAPFEGGWRGAGEVAGFAADPATGAERDWRSIDPRRGLRGDDEALSPQVEGDEVPADLDDDEQDFDEELVPPTIMVDLPPRRS